MNPVPILLCIALLFPLLGTTTPPLIAQQPAAVAVTAGRRVFNQSCAGCHDVAGASFKSGPVLKGYYRRNPRPVDEHVRGLIQRGGAKMPAFHSLAPGQINDLLAYLKTL